MSEEYPELPEEISSDICDVSARRRSRGLEIWYGLAERPRAYSALALLGSPYPDVRDGVLDACTPDIVACGIWREAVEAALADDALMRSPDCVQGILIIMRRMSCEFSDVMSEFYRRCLDSDDIETRYQAFCLAEIREEASEAYESRVRAWLSSQDEDFRIVACQAVVRLNPSWGLGALRERYALACGVEAFHLRLGLIRLCPESERGAYLPALTADSEDSRYAFAAIGALSKFGTADAVPALLRVARSLFGEPTVRVAAASAAANLGSEEGLRLLKKFAASRHGNPEYAKQLLEALKKENLSKLQ